MKNASFQTLVEDLKISFRFALKNVISYVLAIIGVFMVAGLLLIIVAAIVFVPLLFTMGFGNMVVWFESFNLLAPSEGATIALGIFLIALPFITPFFVAVGALFGMSREIVESEGTTAEGVFQWFKRKFFPLADGGLVMFVIIAGPVFLVSFGAVALFGDQVLNIAFISSGTTTTLSPILSGLSVIWFVLSTGFLTMLFPAIIDGYSVVEATKKSFRMSIDYFDRIIGFWISFILIIVALIAPILLTVFMVPFSFGLEIAAIAIYAVPMVIFFAFVALPALSIGLTRVYMILTADNEDLTPQTEESESGPGFVGGL
ncbi:MAG: hypothetical protein E3J86_05480 [Candidatus Thorarchaeota archaeon]|nr:MAG: hypothetical protein E3J86_05480 [Candidatus Thorarchaeota archaeon]